MTLLTGVFWISFLKRSEYCILLFYFLSFFTFSFLTEVSKGFISCLISDKFSWGRFSDKLSLSALTCRIIWYVVGKGLLVLGSYITIRIFFLPVGLTYTFILPIWISIYVFIFSSICFKNDMRDFTSREADFGFCIVITLPKPHVSVSQYCPREFLLLTLTARVNKTTKFESTVLHKPPSLLILPANFEGSSTIFRFDNLLTDLITIILVVMDHSEEGYRWKLSKGTVWGGFKWENFHCPQDALSSLHW